ncbi:MAG: hypothetical protein ACTSYI_05915 [Promethearchaeota archaeon]
MSEEEMSSVVSCSMVSGLEGHTGSNPMVLKVHPPVQDFTEETIISKVLPHGAKPYNFYTDTMDSRKILVYTFEIHQDGRNDLGSIGFVVGKDTIIDNLKIIIQALVKDMEDNQLLNFTNLQAYLPKIIEGLNKQSKIKIEKMRFDVASVLRNYKIELRHSSRKARGMF